MSNDYFLSIESNSQGLYKEKGSKFLSFAYPVETEGEVKEILDQLKKEYHDARHHCFAFVLGVEQNYYRANDAGEPNHSAGDPILGQIRSKGITNTLVVVVRYFGGTKLGIPGLVNAYKNAAADALNNAVVIEKIVSEKLEIVFDYLKMNEIMKLIKEYGIQILHQDFTNDCRIIMMVRKRLINEIRDKMSLLNIQILPNQ